MDNFTSHEGWWRSGFRGELNYCFNKTGELFV